MNGLITSIQNEHAPVFSPQDSPSPSEKTKVEDLSELKLALSLIEKAKTARKTVDKDWAKYEAYYNGDQWYGKNRPTYRAAPVANKIRPAIQTILPIMTDTQPGVDITPQEPSDFSFASSLSEVVRVMWNKRCVTLTITEALLDSLKFNGGILKVVWDQDLEGGSGDVHVVRIDPHNFYPAEGAIDCNNNCPYIIEFYPARVGELKRKYPGKAGEIRATGGRDKQKENGSTGFNTDILLVSPIDKATGPFPEIGGSTGSDNDVVWVAEIWIDDESVEEVALDDGTTEQRKKYPDGKIIQCVPDLNLLLTVDENPYRDGLKPYIRLIDTIVPGRFWGEGEIGPYIAVQDMINRTLATIYDYLNAMTNPVWILDSDSGIDPSMITNQIGLILLKNRGSEVRREPAPSMPPQVFEFYSMMNQAFDTESGVHDITQGRKPVGVTAAEAMNTMQEAAQTRIRLKERNMQSALNQMGHLIVSRILQFYRKPRIVKITGDNNFPEYYEFYIEDTPDGKMKFNKLDYKFDEVGKKYVPSQRGYQSVGESKGMFDIQIVSGTSLPAMKAQRGNLALRLADSKMIDQKALLDSLEWPNKEEIINRMQEDVRKAAEAQQQQPQGEPKR
jgi:hypothetical protein